MTKNQKFVKVYLEITIILGILSLIPLWELFTKFTEHTLLRIVFGTIYLLASVSFVLYAALSIYALYWFIQNQSNKLLYIIPSIEILTTFTSLGLAFLSVSYDITKSYKILITLGPLFDVLTIMLAGYLLVKLKLVKIQNLHSL